MFNWYAFWVYVIVTAVSPGPNSLLSMSNGSQKGLVRALPFNFGIGAGLTVVMIGCAVFCSVLTSVLPKIQLVMRFIGAAYMLYLAWTTFVGDGKMDAEGAFGLRGPAFDRRVRVYRPLGGVRLGVQAAFCRSRQGGQRRDVPSHDLLRRFSVLLKSLGTKKPARRALF